MKNRNTIVFTVLRIVIGVGLIVYLATSGAINSQILLHLIQRWPLVFLVLILFFVEVVVSAWRLILLLRPHHIYLPLGEAIRLTSIGVFFNICLPGATGGDLVKIYYVIKGRDVSRTKVITIAFMDRIVGMFALMILPVMIAPFFLNTVLSSDILMILLLTALTFSSILIIAMSLAFSTKVNNLKFIDWIFSHLPFGKYLRWIFETVHLYRNHKKTLLTGIGLSLFIHIASLFVILVITLSVAPEGFTWLLIVFTPIGFIANSLPLTPGGLGVGEAAFDRLFRLVGLGYGAEILLSWRILMVLVGLSGLYFYLQGRRQYPCIASADPFKIDE